MIWQDWLQQHFSSAIVQQTPLTGGCINDVRKITLANGLELVVKLDAQGRYAESEAFALRELNKVVSSLTPKVRAVSAKILVLTYIKEVSGSKRLERQLGERLAYLHSVEQAYFGFPIDNFCGATPQVNQSNACGYRFFGQHRLGFQADLAKNNGLIDQRHYERIGRFIEKLTDWVPQQKPALLHGDLWSGNRLYGANGHSYLIDPASYYGWPEADLAMTLLFGGFSEDFYQSYQHHSDIDDKWPQRADIYNLYHLLNHLNLFGRHYWHDIASTLAKYGV